MRMHIRRMPIYIIIMVPPFAAYFIGCSSFPDPHITWIYRYYKYGNNICQGVSPKDLHSSQNFVRHIPNIVCFRKMYDRKKGIFPPDAYLSPVFRKMKHPRKKIRGEIIIRGTARRSCGSCACRKKPYCRRRDSGRCCRCGLRYKPGSRACKRISAGKARCFCSCRSRPVP